MLFLKEGVSINGVKPEIIHAMHVAKDVWAAFNKDFTVTSVTDGKHGVNSLHYVGYAFDSRFTNLTDSQRIKAKEMLVKALGDEYDIVMEADHLHLEYQPERGMNL